MLSIISNLIRYCRKEQTYEKLTLDYEAHWKKMLGSSIGEDRTACYKEVTSLIKDNSRVLDIGCGNGDFLIFLKRNKLVQELGIDISENAVESARQSGINAKKIDVSTYSLKEFGNFDYVVLLDILEHTQNAEEILLKIKEASPFASIIVSIPNTGYYYCRFRLFFGGRFIFQLNHPAWHVRFWTLKDFNNMAKNLGLKIDKTIPYFGERYLKDAFPALFAEYLLFQMHFKKPFL